MMRYRTLGMPREACCCLPTPYRIPKSVAGMAFNFSLVEVVPKSSRSSAAVELQYGTERPGNRLFGFALPHYSHAT
jgi:hypothetical protein